MIPDPVAIGLDLKRTADALERIAAALEAQAQPPAPMIIPDVRREPRSHVAADSGAGAFRPSRYNLKTRPLDRLRAVCADFSGVTPDPAHMLAALAEGGVVPKTEVGRRMCEALREAGLAVHYVATGWLTSEAGDAALAAREAGR